MKRLACSLVAASALVGGAAHAAPVVLTGNYLQVSINDNGHIGQGGTSPGLIYDRNGTGTFNPNFDYIAPGTPFEAFSVRVGPSGFYSNSNSGGSDISTLTALSNTSTGDVNSASWTGRVAGLFDITNAYSFRDGDQNIRILTTITALSNLTDVRFGRAADPDPDSRAFGTSSTNNQRGTDRLPASDFVGSVGSRSGTPLALYSNSPVSHNTGLSSACCSQDDPDFYLGGGNLGNSSVGDHGIGLGFALGNLLSGQAITLEYFYVTAGSLGEVEVPGDPDGRVPLPGSLALLGLGAFGLAGSRRKRAA